MSAVLLHFTSLMTDREETVARLLQSLAATAGIFAVIYFWLPAVLIPRGLFVLAGVLVIAGVIGWRAPFEWVVRRVGPRERLLLIGTTDAGINLAHELLNRRVVGVEIVGFVDPDPTSVGHPLFNIGTIDDIADIV